MRHNALFCVAVGWAVAVGLATLRGNPENGADAERVAKLIKQLGADAFAKREAASKELESIGEPARAALRQAAASDGDPEIRRRAEQVIQAIAGRIAQRELAKLQGTWSLASYETDGKLIKGEDKSHTFTVKGEKWSIHVGGQVFQAGTVQLIEVKEKVNAIDLLITEGGNVGATAVSIYSLEGDSLKYLNCGDPRPAEFVTKEGDGRHYLTFRRAKP
ncbi:MAG TPA: TIGR03067 domain-containing protein [Fimbriiglobus sp.]|nr:TIGR03067 domain-containing protein [Fimbriiglobus sp.]